ncbi:hypothetical protein [Aequorivita sp. Q41]|uniref:hypothetical protein n=1 Tax=Aequorivita sp. Q41 TaxID=3153300 RepID=UPI003241E61A
MKTYILLLVMVLSLNSCNKESNEPSGGYPKIYNLNFELFRVDGSTYEDGEVEITNNTGIATLIELTNGQYPFLGLGKIVTEETQGSGRTLYGSPCGGPNCVSDFGSIEFASGAEGVDVKGSVPFEKDKYWLLRYANEDVDTLRIHDVQTINPYNRTFTFFVNEQQIEATNFIYEEYAITVQK